MEQNEAKSQRKLFERTSTHTHTAIMVTRSAKHRSWKIEKLRVTMQ